MLDAQQAGAAGVAVAAVETRPLQVHRTVPARLQYNDNRHVAIKVATDGILTEVFVKPGDRVEAGQTLATVSSPEIGTARADVLQRAAEVEVARQKQEWARQTSENTARLAAAIRHRRPFEEIDRDFRKLQLGDAREKLLASYSKFSLAEQLNTSIQDAGKSGAVAARVVREREGELQVSRATLDSLTEQIEFEARVAFQEADAALRDSERRLAIALKHRDTLLGTAAVPRETRKFAPDQPADLQAGDESVREDASVMSIRAPFAGTIEDRQLSVNERFRQGDTLFILADTSSLWISADLREHDWKAVSLQPGTELTAQFPALPGKSWPARVEWVGREVLPETNAVPLVAVIDNANALLRPGLFARVSLPIGEPKSVLAVPESAVLEHEGAQFVFVEESERRFRRVEIRTGESDGPWREVTSGLTGGERVVTAGAFVLKSAMLLEAEAESGGA